MTMTIKVPLSMLIAIPAEGQPVLTQAQKDSVKSELAKSLAEYRDAMVAHIQTVGKPAPVVHDVIAALVRRVPVAIDKPDEFHIADYEIIDDHPVPPPPPLPESVKQLRAVNVMSDAEREAALRRFRESINGN